MRVQRDVFESFLYHPHPRRRLPFPTAFSLQRRQHHHHHHPHHHHAHQPPPPPPHPQQRQRMAKSRRHHHHRGSYPQLTSSLYHHRRSLVSATATGLHHHSAASRHAKQPSKRPSSASAAAVNIISDTTISTTTTTAATAAAAGNSFSAPSDASTSAQPPRLCGRPLAVSVGGERLPPPPGAGLGQALPVAGEVVPDSRSAAGYCNQRAVVVNDLAVYTSCHTKQSHSSRRHLSGDAFEADLASSSSAQTNHARSLTATVGGPFAPSSGEEVPLRADSELVGIRRRPPCQPPDGSSRSSRNSSPRSVYRRRDYLWRSFDANAGSKSMMQGAESTSSTAATTSWPLLFRGSDCSGGYEVY
ncbi:hypothetical protein ZHAS_00005143 [Anopheles sinensis]|uniref:Uncharacterized protein n=1 Tax=Anopheles sinensis TaxID=74873 RepID=A0A084VJ27_ANOSI|nr:hypothetical protein ZHAS_00005143 [Anopheles sinensis]